MSKILMCDLTQDKTPKNEKFHPERKENEKLTRHSSLELLNKAKVPIKRFHRVET